MNELDTLRKEVRMLKTGLGLCAVLVAAVALMGATGTPKVDSFDVVKVQRLEVVDAQGNIRMMLTGPQRMPGAGGPDDYSAGGRNFQSPAIIFYDEHQKEYGGIVPRATDQQGDLSAIMFDYAKQEAIGMFTRQSADGSSGFAGLIINDPPPAGMSHEDAIRQSFNRIMIANPQRNAEILMSDTDGRGRIRMRVTEDGQAYLEILDKDGKVQFRAPETR